jgi:hypothetical protein
VNHKKKSTTKSEKLIARLKLAPINAWVGGWAVFWYLTFQLPFALISAVGLGMGAVVYQYVRGVLGERITDDIVSGLLTAGGFSNAVIEYVAKDIFQLSFNPMLIFIVPFALLLLLAIFQLILTWFIYSLAGINSLTGEKAGVKNTMFLIAGVGVVIPVLNLIPLMFLWVIVVWKYPK